MGQREAPEYRQVYFIEAVGLGFVKIGCADHARKRLATLQVGSPIELKLLGVLHVDDAPGMERRLHIKFDPHHVRGEWFRLDESMRDILAVLLAPEDRGIKWATKPQPYVQPLVTFQRRPGEGVRAFAKRCEREFNAATAAAA